MLHTIASILSNPAIILGIIAAVGLIALRKSTSDIIKGTLKTVFGFIMLQQGSNIIVNALVPFSTMFTEAFGLKGIVAEDNSLVAAVQVVLGKETALILLFSFLINLVIARITKWKYIFLTGHMMFSFAGTMAIVFNLMGFSSITTIILGSIIQGISMVFFPAISQPFVRKVTGNNHVAFGFWGSSWISLSGYIGGLVGNKEKSSEDVKVPKSLDFLKDMSILMGIVMVIIYVVTSLFVDHATMQKISSGQSAIQFSIMNALTFVVGILVLLQGVRMFLGEIVPAFKGVGEKIVPGAKPALDVPIFFSFAPIAVTLGFLSALVGSLIVTFISSVLPVVVLPSVIGLFFMGGAAGVFGNSTGGRRGAIVAGFVLGLSWSLLIAITYPLINLEGYGIEGLWFASPDAIIVAVIIRLVGMLFGIH
ncbi:MULTISPECIES: PTS ascorbate transporter subunit IIC [Heyndrickxia]|jgi:PTS system ascorbate-specific IIC component|uniref:Ascorbate-specific PTS system EIIC component n=1 Tax=Heyndrickxia oleronia TaxID=38875 RepID=A0A8E2IBF4_9BACI|nr:PTS ascorbate transporter subunit IIC [Heyndrickxia oleronia]NYV65659.1 PTS ascorbate transporter subunit IIC [Bacillus sp. Gen3]MCI1589046.1 PTS ascorbate transporter subunit IIC [Heyndrickxia oleronia]MCI1611862.1 PTS ascorbate transporter subunit IIC [Heyndrickxia oleronia]MCI1743131.1 PTS ascorbate transporter subunit IIC [Heyndrickxia oleronia]MCI1759625.1 PTS ascorbate transporter subunit IIC [Heyndrickxia oleronia]